MKKLNFVIGGVVVLTTAVFFSMKNNHSIALTPVQLENIEALATEEGSGDQIPCWSSSERNINKAYVDCASCKRIEGWKGTDTKAYCTR